MEVCESYAELQTYKWSIIRGIVLKEPPDKPPALKPIVSTVNWSDELQQMGELCQNAAEECEGNTVETSKQYSSQEESSQSGTDTSNATLQEISSLGIPTAQRRMQPKQTQNPLPLMKKQINSMNRSWCVVPLKVCRFEMLLMISVVQESENSSYRTILAYK